MAIYYTKQLENPKRVAGMPVDYPWLTQEKEPDTGAFPYTWYSFANPSDFRDYCESFDLTSYSSSKATPVSAGNSLINQMKIFGNYDTSDDSIAAGASINLVSKETWTSADNAPSKLQFQINRGAGLETFLEIDDSGLNIVHGLVQVEDVLNDDNPVILTSGTAMVHGSYELSANCNLIIDGTLVVL